MSEFIIISYYTKNTGYEKEVLHLISSLEKLKRKGEDISYTIKGIDNLGNWHLNTRYKAKFIKESLLYFDIPVLFVDADAIFCKYPELIYTIEQDIACHFREDRDNELLSGTLYFKNNERTIALLDEWVRLNEVNPSILEQKNLQAIVGSNAIKDLTIYKLPVEYTFIYDIKSDKEPIIKHMQASRRFRKLV